jgi:hypothetical protein
MTYTIVFRRRLCQYHALMNRPGFLCGMPTVDFVKPPEGVSAQVRFWLCAEHFDTFTRIMGYQIYGEPLRQPA